ncbi:MAG: hypothetical protein K8I82_32185, partial [Anaerolineae bacterium]|nr:hypothetical protein [Anaerolineae bacterium]
FCLETVFVQVNQRVQKTWQFILFRLFSLTLGRFQTAAYWIKNLLVKVLVRRRHEFPLRLVRRVHFGEESVEVEDEIFLTGELPLTHLRQEAKFASIHMGSSRYFQTQELEMRMLNASDWAEQLSQTRRVTVRRRYPEELP